jgi:class III poly(R)-hydroxyalkanoic acid synthase PhaE subunit
MESNSTKNFFESMMDSQKQFVDTMTQTTENLKNGFNGNVNNDYFKKWFDSQMSFFNQGNAAKENEKSTGNNPFEYFTNMFQNNLTKGQDMASFMNNVMNNWMTWNQNMNKFNTGVNDANNMFQNWNGMLTKTYQDMLNNFGVNGTQKEAFMGLFNTQDMYMKMYEFWSPMMKQMQENSFNMDTFKTMFNAEQYKEMMDRMFQLNPEMSAQMKDFYLNAIKSNMNMSKEAYEQMKKQMESMPTLGADSFEKALSQYNEFSAKMNDTMSPLVKMMTPGKDREQMIALNELGNKMVAYQVREAQFRYMLYTTGLKAMETLAEKVSNKIQNGEEYKDFNGFYNEWISTNDTVFGELFSSEEYSKFQADFTSVTMTVKKSVEKQMEKMMANVPVVTRSEMDDLYKTVYEMNKHIKALEKKIAAYETESTTEVKAAKTAKK